MAVFTAVFVLVTLAVVALVPDGELHTLASNLLFPTVGLATTMTSWRAAARSWQASHRLGVAWGILAIAQTLWWIGDLIWLVLESVLHVEPFPSIADGFYLAYYLLFLTGVLLLPGRRQAGFHLAKRVLDAASVLWAITVIYWLAWLGPLSGTLWGDDTATVLVSIGYPIGDLVLIWATTTLLMRRLSGLYWLPILFLGLSAVVGAGVDAAFAYTAVLGTYASGGLIDVGWLVVSLLSLWAATFQSVAPPVAAQEGEGLEIGPEERSSWHALPRFLLPYVSLAGLIGLEAASWSPTASEWLKNGSVVLEPGAALLFVLISLRQVLTLVDNERLSGRLRGELAERRRIEADLRDEVAARQELQQAVQVERDFAQVVLNTLGQGVAVLSPTGNCEYLNPVGAQILGLHDPQDLVGVNLGREKSVWISPEVWDPLPARVERQGLDQRFDAQYTRADGQTLDLLTVVSPRMQSGEFHGSVVVFTDVTDHKALERELAEAVVRAQLLARDADAATRAKSEFLANMSHEIRTPMNAILGMAELLMDISSSEEQQSRIQVMIDSGQALLTIINDVLDFSKIEAGRVELDRHPFNLTALVEGAVDLLLVRAQPKGLHLSTLVDPAIPDTLVGDSGRVRQVLLNVLSNAMKFTSEGHVSVRADLLGCDAASARVRLTIEDTGIGISAEAQARLFQPFEQAETSTTRRYGGTGLGLALVKSLLDLLGGTVRLESQPGVGTTITLDLPFDVPASTSERAEPVTRPRTDRVLVVEPDPVNREILERYLAAPGRACRMFSEATTALAHLRRDPDYDVVIIGLWQAIPDTIQVYRELTTDMALAKIPRIAIGDLPEDALPHDARLTRPLKRATIGVCLADALDPHSLSRVIDVAVPTEPAPSLAENPVVARPRVLLAEDNPVNQRVAELQLDKLGYDVDVVSDGAAAVAAYRAAPERYALILMDCQMPILDGFAATSAIRDWEGVAVGLRHIPIVAMTANAMAGDREICLAAGMDEYLAKPVGRQALTEVLARCRDSLVCPH